MVNLILAISFIALAGLLTIILSEITIRRDIKRFKAELQADVNKKTYRDFSND